jgi:hypothetical protein
MSREEDTKNTTESQSARDKVFLESGHFNMKRTQMSEGKPKQRSS